MSTRIPLSTILQLYSGCQLFIVRGSWSTRKSRKYPIQFTMSRYTRYTSALCHGQKSSAHNLTFLPNDCILVKYKFKHIHKFDMYCGWRSSNQERRVRIPLIGLALLIACTCPIASYLVVCLYSVSSVKMRGDCLLCSYIRGHGTVPFLGKLFLICRLLFVS